MLTLPIKKQWFDMIVEGIKKEEYRSLTPRYAVMFKNAAKLDNVFKCRLRNGYMSNSPSAIITCSYHIGHGRPEWGAVENVDYFVLTILSVEKE